MLLGGCCVFPYGSKQTKSRSYLYTSGLVGCNYILGTLGFGYLRVPKITGADMDPKKVGP